MKLLFDFAERHTFGTTVVGSLSGFSGVLVEHIDGAAKIVGFVGTCAGTLTAIFGAIVMFRKLIRNSGQRRAHELNDQVDDLPWL